MPGRRRVRRGRCELGWSGGDPFCPICPKGDIARPGGITGHRNVEISGRSDKRHTQYRSVDQHGSVPSDRAGSLECITHPKRETGEEQTIPASAIFIFIGARSHGPTGSLTLIALDGRGFIYTGQGFRVQRERRRRSGWKLDREPFLLETNVPGIFAAGDVLHGSVKRVASAVGAGSICVQMIHQHLRTLSRLAERAATAKSRLAFCHVARPKRPQTFPQAR